MPIPSTPTRDEARAAMQKLEEAIFADAEDARGPEKGTPLEPGQRYIWEPARWTLRYMRAKRGYESWIWGMDTTDTQVVAYAYAHAPSGEMVVIVTHNGHERAIARKSIPYHPTAMFKDWFPWKVKYEKQIINV